MPLPKTLGRSLAGVFLGGASGPLPPEPEHRSAWWQQRFWSQLVLAVVELKGSRRGRRCGRMRSSRCASKLNASFGGRATARATCEWKPSACRGPRAGAACGSQRSVPTPVGRPRTRQPSRSWNLPVALRAFRTRSSSPPRSPGSNPARVKLRWPSSSEPSTVPTPRVPSAPRFAKSYTSREEGPAPFPKHSSEAPAERFWEGRRTLFTSRAGHPARHRAPDA
jgi:hypothetical protein